MKLRAGRTRGGRAGEVLFPQVRGADGQKRLPQGSPSTDRHAADLTATGRRPQERKCGGRGARHPTSELSPLLPPKVRHRTGQLTRPCPGVWAPPRTWQQGGPSHRAGWSGWRQGPSLSLGPREAVRNSHLRSPRRIGTSSVAPVRCVLSGGADREAETTQLGHRGQTGAQTGAPTGARRLTWGTRRC